MSVFVALLALSQPVTSSTAAALLIEELVGGRGELPALCDVQRAAVEVLLVPGDDDVSSWAPRARWRGLVPRVDAALGSDADLVFRGSLETPERLSTTEGRQLGVDVAVRFELGELVFSDLELRASREAIARAAAINLARDRATQIYFERLSLVLEQRESDDPSLAFRAARLDGLLDAITGGRLVRPRKDSSK